MIIRGHIGHKGLGIDDPRIFKLGEYIRQISGRVAKTVPRDLPILLVLIFSLKKIAGVTALYNLKSIYK